MDLTQFHSGQTRDSVMQELGLPLGTFTESDGASCDDYRLYTTGYSAGGMMLIAAAEGDADVATAGPGVPGPAPAEDAAGNEKHPVTFCYKDQVLARINPK
ncbi:MAG: hypothetical protein ABSG46_03985 [Candidatus Binataceae bacterium]